MTEHILYFMAGGLTAAVAILGTVVALAIADNRRSKK